MKNSKKTVVQCDFIIFDTDCQSKISQKCRSDKDMKYHNNYDNYEVLGWKKKCFAFYAVC